LLAASYSLGVEFPLYLEPETAASAGASKIDDSISGIVGGRRAVMARGGRLDRD